jgi:long-chain acyl-CoA synthetase
MSAINANKPGYFGKGSVEVGPEPPPSEGRIRHLAISADKLITQPIEGIDTLPDVVAYAARTYGTKPALGWRDVIQTYEEEREVQKIVNGQQIPEKKKWKYFQLSDYRYLSYIDVQVAVSELSRALVHLGVNKGHVINIYSQTWYVLHYLWTAVRLLLWPTKESSEHGLGLIETAIEMP